MRIVLLSTLLLFSVRAASPQPAKTLTQNLLTTEVWLFQAQQPPSPTPQQRQDKPEVNSTIQSNLKDALSGDPILSGSQIDATVDDVAITLSGTAQTEGQHRRALELASQYARYRKIVDKVVVK